MAAATGRYPVLDTALADATLAHLGVGRAAPDVVLLDALVAAFKARVPWESATRIVKRAATADTAACPRWPEEFWADVIERGGGGTCYESNYAFFALLRALGYDGYLTLNNMRDVARPGCHAAIVLSLGGEPWLADVGLSRPLALLSLRAREPRTWPAPLHRCTVHPTGPDTYEIGLEPGTSADPTRAAHAYTLLDRPVDDAAYRAAVTADYGPDGLFLDQLIVSRVIDGVLWRFTTNRRPPALVSFDGTEWAERSVTTDVAETVADRFGVDAATLQAALGAVGAPH